MSLWANVVSSLSLVLQENANGVKKSSNETYPWCPMLHEGFMPD